MMTVQEFLDLQSMMEDHSTVTKTRIGQSAGFVVTHPRLPVKTSYQLEIRDNEFVPRVRMWGTGWFISTGWRLLTSAVRDETIKIRGDLEKFVEERLLVMLMFSGYKPDYENMLCQ